MFHDLDEALRKLLIREIPIKNGDVDIKFEQPKREWSARLSKPTIDIFMYDLRENVQLRGAEQWLPKHNPDGTISQKRNPVRVDVNYMITTWATDPEDEHRLLTSIMMALFRYERFPKDLLLENMADQPAPVTMRIGQPDMVQSPTDLWNVLANEMRPVISLTVTMVLDPYIPIITPPVRTREVRFGQAAEPDVAQKLIEEAGVSVYWTVGGSIITKKKLDSLCLTLVERDQNIPIQEDGRFAIGKLRAGDYSLEISSEGRALKKVKITVPSPDFDLEL